jgi:Mg2+/Co2+ transporter CorB
MLSGIFPGAVSEINPFTTRESLRTVHRLRELTVSDILMSRREYLGVERFENSGVLEEVC